MNPRHRSSFDEGQLEELIRNDPRIMEEASRIAVEGDRDVFGRVRESRQELVGALVDVVNATFARHPDKRFPTLRSLLTEVLRQDRVSRVRRVLNAVFQNAVFQVVVSVLAVFGGYEAVSRLQPVQEARPLLLSIAEPDSLGGRTLRLEGYGAQAESKWASQIVAFDADGDPKKPIWAAALDQNDIPADLAARRQTAYEGGQFSVRLLRSFEIFSELPGEEIVTVFNHNNYSQCSLRILDARGRTVWSVWHDGNLTSAHWAEEDGILVAAGVNGEVLAEDRGLPQYRANHPKVIIGLRPELGQTEPAWIDTVDHTGGVAPVFYRCLHAGDSPEPIDAIRAIEVRPKRPGEAPIENCRIALRFETKWELTSHSFGIDVAGNSVEHSTVTRDAYRRAQRAGDLPDPSVFRLIDLPPAQIEPEWIPGRGDERKPSVGCQKHRAAAYMLTDGRPRWPGP